MRVLFTLLIVLATTPAIAQTIIGPEDTFEISWTHDCERVCDQAVGTAGFTIKIDDVTIFNIAPDSSQVFSQQVAVAAYNSAGSTDSESVEYEVMLIPPDAPSTPNITVVFP
jgi:hypothetical protein